jgi:tRNA nucleotidyltransferase (CCA-adding enzyme)
MLEKALPPSRLALLNLIGEYASAQKTAIYIVGGFVRDLLLDRPSLDFDFVVESDALQFAHALAQKYGGRVVTHKRFNTAKWLIKNIHNRLLPSPDEKTESRDSLPDSLDFISARTEFYDHPTALPTVERSGIKLDLHRRDFTINTLALRLDGHHYGELYDFWGGLQDLDKKLVRVLHSLSFVDDPTRLLRAVRFEQRFQFKIEKRTLELMGEARELLHQLSGERIRHEFDLIFNELDLFPIMRRLQQLDLLSQIHPDLKWTSEHELAFSKVYNYTQYSVWNLPRLVGNTPVRNVLAYLVWLADLENGSGREICQRLRLPRNVCETLSKIIDAIGNINSLRNLNPSQLTRVLEKIPLYGVFALFCVCTDENLRQKINDYAVKWRMLTPGIDGDTLLDRGIPPGPEYARILSRVRDAWLDGNITKHDEELALLNELIKESGDQHIG